MTDVGSEEQVPHIGSPSAVPSRARLQVMLSGFVVVLVVALSALTFFVVTRIFDRVTPKIRADLVWKTERGARELAHTADIGLAVDDRKLIQEAFHDYTLSEDVLALLAVSAEGKLVAAYGQSPEPLAELFRAPPGGVRTGAGYFVAWNASEIEGAVVGRVAVVVSSARLDAGERLRRNILAIAGISCLAALLLSLGFVRFYIGPLIALTLRALGSLRELTASLEDRVRRRTRQLTENKAELEQMLERLTATQRKLMEASRVAGMAEVATSVLHNVGNVLNSANVSGQLVVDRLRRSKVTSLGKVTQLLREHEADLGAFVTTDERGRRLPAYLATLAQNLESERTEMMAELEALATNMNHIKVIINMQQTHAKSTGGVNELVLLQDVVEEALRFNQASFEKHGIEIVRDYHPLPRMAIDRHKLFQILMNLLSNARHAIKARGEGRRIEVRVGPRGLGTAELAISDNGIGVPPENMGKIFMHGFTTKNDGHGFGLHSSALAAKDLGGELRCVSDGRDRGATFTIELPLRPVLSKELAVVVAR